MRSSRTPDTETFDIIKYWEGYHNKQLSKMALEFLSIPASSANVERLFSTARSVDRYNRQNMKPETKGKFILCKNWWKLYLILQRS